MLCEACVRSPVIVGLMVLAGVMASTRTYAADCKPLSYYTGVPMDWSNGVLTVPVAINGTSKKALFDTGGVTNNMRPHLVESLGLTPRQSRVAITDVHGRTSNAFVKVDQFDLGKIKIRDMMFQVSLFDSDTVDVELTNVIMNSFDLDLDFGAGRLNFFLQDHCPGQVMYWPAEAVAEIPFKIDAASMTIPVTVDGKSVTALIDTGSSRTFMNRGFGTREFGLSLGSPDTPAEDVKINGREDLQVYTHKFSTIDFGGIVVRNLTVRLIPDRVNSRENLKRADAPRIPSREFALPDLIIGLDILQKLHIYVSYKERKLYIGGADDKAGKLLPPVASR